MRMKGIVVNVGEYEVVVSARSVDGRCAFNKTDTSKVLEELCSICLDAMRLNKARGYIARADRCGETAESIYDAVEQARYLD